MVNRITGYLPTDIVSTGCCLKLRPKENVESEAKFFPITIAWFPFLNKLEELWFSLSHFPFQKGLYGGHFFSEKILLFQLRHIHDFTTTNRMGDAGYDSVI